MPGRNYTPKERKKICERALNYVSEGMSLRKACTHKDMPTEGTIRMWSVEDPEFFTQYARAREARAEARSDKIDQISDEVHSGQLDPQAARVIIDAEKWQAGKENPKRYGDKLTLDGDMNMRLSDEQLESRLAQLVGKAGAFGALGGERTPEVEAEAVRSVSRRRPVKA